MARTKLTDRLIAAGLLVWAATDVPWWWRPPGHGAATPVILGFVLLMLTQSMPFLWWRRWPLLAAALPASVLAIRAGLGLNPFSAAAATLVGAFGLGAWGGRRLRQAARIMTGVAVAGAAVVLVTSNGFRAQALPLALLAVALGLGEVTAANRDAATASARLAHDQERARIARELHDVLSHQLSAIAIQAGAARIASRDDPAVATYVIGNIEDIARAGLTDLNRIVGALRRDAAEQLDRRPQPRLDDLPDLVAGARAAGLPVELHAADLPPSLPLSVELAGFRVVQESLTNALRYAQAPTRVRLACINGGLDVLVENDAPAVLLAAAAARVTHDGQTIASDRCLPGSGGRGLAGLTERAQILGGTLDAGRQPDGGFAVHAWLPVRP
ncbi:MAG TPA: histidine kinase [Streptosporangiaceae bacterium]|nr:histidine kinase [Streptosporangiaceae bacterium]